MIDLVVLLLTGMRMLGFLYHSGHVLFLAYTFATTKSKTYRAFALPMIAVTAYYKLVEWGDVSTPILGLVLAFVMVWVRNKKREQLQTAARCNA